MWIPTVLINNFQKILNLYLESNQYTIFSFNIIKNLIIYKNSFYNKKL